MRPHHQGVQSLDCLYYPESCSHRKYRQTDPDHGACAIRPSHDARTHQPRWGMQRTSV